MLNQDTSSCSSCSSCSSTRDGQAQCPCWRNGLDEVVDISLSIRARWQANHDHTDRGTVSWHHLSKEQVMKGIIMQLNDGRLPKDVTILIWNQIKREQKTNEDMARTYYEKGICHITRAPTLRPWGRSIEWVIKSAPNLAGRRCGLLASQSAPNPRKVFLKTIRMIGKKDFLHERIGERWVDDDEGGFEEWEWGQASIRSKCRYLRDNDHDDILYLYWEFKQYGLHHRMRGG